MLRAGLLWLSGQPHISRFMRRNRIAGRMAARFVAGETVDTALGVLRDLTAHQISATLDFLGESVARPEEARAARDTYLQVLERIHAARADANVSVKLTQLGLDIDQALCLENLRSILRRAREVGSFVRIDMEGSAHTQKTLDLFTRTVYPEFGDTAGVVLQSYLRRTVADVEAMILLGARVRLCKGAYKEPATIAFPEKRDVDTTYITCLERLLDRGNYPALATHDERLITHAKAYARGRGVDPARFEFQMLYGVRRDLQHELRREGYRVRVYVPFGSHWYPYLMRRLAERPANIGFILGNVVRESLRRR